MLAATCICGSDLWPYRGSEPVHWRRMEPQYVGTVVEVGEASRPSSPAFFVVGSFCIPRQCAITVPASRCTAAAAQGERLRRHTRRRAGRSTLAVALAEEH